ncbi:hypothetical protein OG462_17255 [Streptomyces sp. NBC_01077]|uniref:hypothetical protein n=1 Tax=Streptomyces sp. NBC_01077 TaxID=2903746 RepID=UPI003867F11F|nr:hypothetical protein OG462_17255 [Streptomyces sp. NBC_01077]
MAATAPHVPDGPRMSARPTACRAGFTLPAIPPRPPPAPGARRSSSSAASRTATAAGTRRAALLRAAVQRLKRHSATTVRLDAGKAGWGKPADLRVPLK